MNGKEAFFLSLFLMGGCSSPEPIVIPTTVTSPTTFPFPTATEQPTPTPYYVVYGIHPTPINLYVESLDSVRYVPWKVLNDVKLGNTTFRQGVLFGKGRNLGDLYGPTFPFDVHIDKEATEEFRRKLSHILPQSVHLRINSAPLSMGTGEALQNPGTKEGGEFTISASFDAHVVEFVYPRFKSRSLKDPRTLREFAGEVNSQLLYWMIHEVGHYPHIFSRIDKKKVEATATALEYASQNFKPLIVVKPDARFDYDAYYANLLRR